VSDTDNIHDLFEPDAAQMRLHLERLFGRVREVYPGGLGEIAYTHIEGRPDRAQLFPITSEGLDRAAVFAAEMNRLKRNIYVGGNPRKPGTPLGKRANAGDVEFALLNFADVDKPAGIPKLRAALLPYTWAVMTGRKPSPRVHAYWERAEPTRDMVEWAAMQAALRDAFSGDNIINPDRIMRLAGSVSYPLTQKKIRDGHQIEVTTLRTVYDGCERDPVGVETLRQVYPPSPRQEWSDPDTGEAQDDDASSSRRPNFDAGREGRIDPRVCIRNINVGHELHVNARDLVAHLVGTGHRDWLIHELLTRLLAPVSDGGTLDLITHFIQTARRKYGKPEQEEDFEAYTTAGGRKLPLEWFGDIRPSLDASDFVEGLLCSAGMSVVYGESNCGKTFFMTDLAYHIAAGRRWRGAEVERGGVIYVALEGGFGIKNRIAALRRHYAPAEETGAILFGVVSCSINLLDANADTGPLIELIKEAAEQISVPIRLVVIDTLSRAMNGGNENAPEDMGKLIKSADRIREHTGAHVAFVHHSGKDQARGARGHSSLRAATDTEIEIVREEETDVSIATVNKQRELEIDGQFAFTLKQISLGANKRGKDVTSCVVVAAETPEAGKKVKLTDQEWSLWREIVEIYARDGLTEFRAPGHGFPVMRVASRVALRNWLVKRGKLDVTERVTGVSRISDADRKRLSRTISALSDKGFLGMNEEFIWKLK
jgi:KaiC/GvpD/RAD55 family RecA-like ATPase